MILFFIFLNFIFQSVTFAAITDLGFKFRYETLADTLVLSVELKKAQSKLSKISDPSYQVISEQTNLDKAKPILMEIALLISNLFTQTDILKLSNIVEIPEINFSYDSVIQDIYSRGIEESKKNYTLVEDFESKYNILYISLENFYLMLNDEEKACFWNYLTQQIQISINLYREGHKVKTQGVYFPESFVPTFINTYFDILNLYFKKKGIKGYLKGSKPVNLGLQKQIVSSNKKIRSIELTSIQTQIDAFHDFTNYEEIAKNLNELLLKTEILKKEFFEEFNDFVSNYLWNFYDSLDFDQKTEFDRLMIREMLKSFNFNETFKTLLEKQAQAEIPQLGLFNEILPLYIKIVSAEF
jgi:hypothetical protein